MTTPTRPLARAAALLAIAVAVSGAAGCGDGRGRPALEVTTRSLTTNETGRVMGFENPTSDWSVIWSGAGTISSSNTASEEAHSLGLQGHDYVAMQSIALSSLGAARVGNVFKYDLRLPTAQPDPSWLGGTQAFISIPSLGLNNASVGQAELTGRPLDQWFTISFSLPSSLQTQLAGNYNDLRFTIALNLPHNATGTYLIDNLRLIDGPLGPCDQGNGTPKPAGTVCRAAAGDCDLPEVCDGTSFACPQDSKKATGTVCRESTGTCDPAEACDGTSVSCPADSKAPDGTACSDGNACTQSDSCQAGACVGGSPVTCVATDACHEAGVCDPSLGVCTSPPKPDGTTCDDGNACTQRDSCQSGLCVGDDPKTCTPSDQCHAAGECNTATGECTDPVKADGTFCNDGSSCTQADFCESGICVGEAPVVCVAQDQCHSIGMCDPATGICSSPSKPDGAACTDGSACTQTDSCQAGVCVGSNPVTCVASDQCHDVGQCDTATGLCSNPPKPDGVACSDGNACTRTDSCQAGSCVGSNPVTCLAQDQCHDVGTCDPAKGTCSNPAKPDGATCSDGNGCTQTDTCQAGACVGSNPVTCLAQDQCHGVGTCDPANGTCSNPAKDDGTACTDGNACTQTDTCQAGACVGANPVTCLASDQCHEAGTCNTATGACSNPPKADGTACNDGNGCTQTDTCQSGVCAGSNPTTCLASDQCHEAGTCDPATGACSNPLKANGTACSDGNGCTQTDTCQSGACVGSNPVTCLAQDQCHEAGTCDATTGLCSNPVKANGTACDDGSACTRTDTCQSGTCTGGDAVTCTAIDQCHDVGTCDPGTGVCSNPAKADGVACSDGNGCTQGDTCQAGACTSGPPVVCVASDQCHTAGTCDSVSGACSNPAKPNGATCDDGNACTRTDTCQTGACVGTSQVACPSAGQCQQPGSCDPSSGACVYAAKADGASCSDGNPCTRTDTCQAGSCVGSNPVTCTADNQCRTAGECDPDTGACVHPGVADGIACDDGDGSTSQDSCRAGVCIGIAAEPSPVAATLADTLAFIYSGSNASQVGVANGTIDVSRAAEIHGRILGTDAAPLPAVKVTVVGHPEFGYAVSREDGGYNMVVNGGGVLIVEFTKAGYLKASRRVEVPWQGFGAVDEVRMLQPDPTVAQINFTSPVMQVAPASVVTDSSGTRQATLLVPGGTTATLVMANGSQVQAGTLNVHITEYTVGSGGPASMPASLPPATAYTYAISYTADEAVMAGAKRVTFNQPIYHYLENFIGLPVGMAVPVGFYDEDARRWVPAHNGGVVKILSVENGLAQLDVQGNGEPASAAARTAMGVTDAELASLAQRYQVGQTLWRVPIEHFSIGDFNLTGSAPPDATNPSAQASNSPDQSSPSTACGSIIEIENQVVGERVPVTGTPFSLNYRSNRVAGFKAANELFVKLTGPTIPQSMMSVKLRISVAGQPFETQFAPAANLGYRFLWDGKDGLGRIVNGRQIPQVAVGYQYPVQYTNPPDGNFHAASSFGQLSTNPLLEVAPGRTDTISWQYLQEGAVGTYLAQGSGMGAWTLDVHHAYDPFQVIWRGDGDREGHEVVSEISSLLYPGAYSVDYRIAVAPDGAFYVTGVPPGLSVPTGGLMPGIIWRYDPNTKTHTDFFSVQNAPATELFGMPWYQIRIAALAVAPDGSVYYSAANGYSPTAGPLYIDRVRSNGTYAQSWRVEDSINGTATATVLAIAVAPDGTVYYLENKNTCLRVMKLEADGQKSVVAGGGCTLVAGGDGGPAASATFKAINGAADLAVGPDGSLYVSNRSECRVRRIWPNGIINTVAGSSCPSAGGHTGDGGDPTAAKLVPTAIAVSPDGTLLIGDADYWEVTCVSGDPCLYYGSMPMIQPRGRIRAVHDGYIHPIAGGYGKYAPDHTPALQHPMGTLSDLALGAAGDVIFIEYADGPIGGGIPFPPPDTFPNAIRHVTSPMLLNTGAPRASKDGTEVYVFDGRGRHLTTKDSLTGVVKYQFGYNTQGHLVSITDRNQLITTIERDAATDIATAIVAPNGQRTELTVGPDGYLAGIDLPGGIHHGYTYWDGKPGLLKTYSNPRGSVSSFTYDDLGRVVGEEIPGGCSWTLNRLSGPSSSNLSAPVQVSLMSKMGRTRTFASGMDSNNTETRSSVSSAGLVSSSVKSQADTRTTASPDGMTTSVTMMGDPRYGLQSELPKSTTVTTPSGKQMTVTMSRAVTTGTGGTLLTQVDTRTINGKVSKTTYNATARTLTAVSPVGRTTVTTLDAKGRVAQTQLGNLAPTSYGYDPRGRLSTMTVGTGDTARVTTFGYDELDRLKTITDPLTRVQEYTYDDANRVTVQKFPDGSEVGFGYDANGNVTSVTPPSRPAHTIGFTPNDLMESYTPPTVMGTGATTYEYNLDKQPTIIHRPDGTTINSTYDSAGRLWTTAYPAGPAATDGNVVLTRSYDAAKGTLTSINGSDGQSLSYTYDGDLPLSTTWSGAVSGSVSRTYDSNFRVVSESVNGANTVALGYDDDGLLTSVDGLSITRDATNGLISDSTLGTVTNHRTYDSFGQVATYEAKFGATSLYSVIYTRDTLGRLETKTEVIQGVTTVWGYSYNAAGRLWQVMRNGVTTAFYTYGANGNRQTKTTPDGTESATYDDQDRMVTYGKWAYTYTANGELRTKTDTFTGAVTTYTYDGQGNLRRVNLPDGRTIDYVIDGENRRVGKKINGILVRQWLYRDQLKPAAELDGAGNALARYVDGLVIRGANTYKIVADHLGTPRLLVDRTTGTVTQRLDFDEFGQITSDSNPGFQVLGFAGGIYDPDTGLVRFGARDYDPAAGRWTAKDPIGFSAGQANLYGYVGDNPVNDVDPTGTQSASCKAALLAFTYQCTRAGTKAFRDPEMDVGCAVAIAAVAYACGLPESWRCDPGPPTGTATQTTASTSVSTSTGTSGP